VLSNNAVHIAPIGRSDLPQAAGRLPPRWAASEAAPCNELRIGFTRRHDVT